jgi:hypothetical protein
VVIINQVTVERGLMVRLGLDWKVKATHINPTKKPKNPVKTIKFNKSFMLFIDPLYLKDNLVTLFFLEIVLKLS